MGKTDVDEVRYRQGSILSDGTPADKHDKAYYVLVLVGTGLLLPWNAVLTAFDYFSETYGAWTNLSVPLLNQAANLAFMLLMVKYGARFSFTRRIVSTLLIYIICLLAIPCLSFLADVQKNAALVITFAIFMVLGATCAVLQASLFGLCGSLPPVYTNAIMAGSAVSGVLMNFLMMVCKGLLEKFYHGSDDSSNKIEAFVFFGVSAVVEVFCIMGYLYIVRKPFIQHHVAHLWSVLEDVRPPGGPQSNSPTAVPTSDPAGSLQQFAQPPNMEAQPTAPRRPSLERNAPKVEVRRVKSADGMSRGSADSAAGAASTPSQQINKWVQADDMRGSPNNYSLQDYLGPARERQRSASRSQLAASPDGWPTADARPEQPTNEDMERPMMQDEEMEDLDGFEPSISVVLHKVKWHVLAVLSIFFVSLYVFPGFMTVLCASGVWGDGKDMDGWMRLILLTCFNVTDLAGRLVAPWAQRVLFSENALSKIFLVSAARLAAVPLAWLVVLGSIDTVYIPGMLMVVLGFTNGLLGSLCMMSAPGCCESHEQEMAGTIMSVFLMLGITCGALAQDTMTPIFNSHDFGNCHD